MSDRTPRDATVEWVHVSYEETSRFTETYGFAGNQGKVNLEGLRMRPAGPSSTLLIFMHPTSTLQLLPVPRAIAGLGAHVLCAASRYARNDAALIMEKVLLDLGAYVRYAKEVWGYRHVVLVGWSGGGALAAYYQSQAERPTITQTPAGDPVDIPGAGLIPADALVFHAAHLSRARVLLDAIDPSVVDESRPDVRDRAFDLYDPNCPDQPPYAPQFVARYRQAQKDRVDRITRWVRDTLAMLKAKDDGEVERGFVVHRTMADPRYLDSTLDPNDRRPGWCYLGDPRTVNNGPVGLARFSTLRSWLSQWSYADTRADAMVCAGSIKAPTLVIENSADDAVPQPHGAMLFAALGSPDKRFRVIRGATHYYAGQPALLGQAVTLIQDWLNERGMAFSVE